jgi:RNA polymerase sigma-70 factor (ECF subfamily)
MDKDRERVIAQGLRLGEAGAWGALHDAYAERLWRAVARLMGADSADVADVVQETFLAAARTAGNFDLARGPLWSWLWGIARHHVALHYRKKKRQESLRAAGDWLLDRNGQALRCLEGKGVAPPEVLAAAELATLVRATLTQLPAEYEGVLTAKYLDGESVEQIANQQRSTVTAVRSRLARAREAFREILLRYAVFAAEKEAP